MKYINAYNLQDYAFLNTDALIGAVKAVCVEFHGFSDATMFQKSPERAQMLGKKGIAWVFPYYSVWAWMSKPSQEFNEQVIDAVYEKLQISNNIPLLISGGSMGGLTALCYQVYGKRKVAACAVNCPVTDMSLCFEVYKEFRRAIVSAHILEEQPMEEILERYSPVKLIDRFPNIPYFLLYGEKDEIITANFMPKFLEKMKTMGMDVTYRIQKNMTHCDMEHHREAMEAWCGFLIEHAG